MVNGTRNHYATRLAQLKKLGLAARDGAGRWRVDEALLATLATKDATEPRTRLVGERQRFSLDEHVKQLALVVPTLLTRHPRILAKRSSVGAALTELNRMGERLTARTLKIQPTLTVRSGTPSNVKVTKDLVICAYVSPRGRSTFSPAHSG